MVVLPDEVRPADGDVTTSSSVAANILYVGRHTAALDNAASQTIGQDDFISS
jgi:hypothetical protein